MYRLSKRGQVTLFIALGVMLVFSIATLYAFKSIGQDYGNFKPYIEEVPSDLQPLKRFIEKCVENTAVEGLRKLGAQGGYIDIEQQGIIITPEPTSSEGVEFAPGIKVPYWFYMKSPNSCVGACNFDQSLTPSNKKIEEQLAIYVEENLQYCTRRFEEFPKFTIEDSEPEAQANIGVSNVQVNVLYPLKVNTGTRVTSHSKFFVQIDLNLRKILDAARDIAGIELKKKFLEYTDIELISTYSGVNRNLLPPFAASEMQLKNVFWTKVEVEKKLKSLFEEKYMFLQADPSLNIALPELSAEEYAETALQIYKNLIVPFSYTNKLNVNFNYYSNWPIYLSLNSNSGVVMPEQILPSIIPGLSLAIEKYDTIYDISHPVVIEIEDPDALKEQGYVFRFALESNIRNNEPLKYENNQVFGAELEDSMFCDIDKRNSGEVHLEVRNSITNQPIEGVSVLFNSVDSCVIGQTDLNGELTSNFPVGLGSLTFIHPEYLQLVSPDFTTELDANKEAGIFRMKPLVSKRVAGNIKQLDRLGINQWILENSPRVLGKKESMMIVFERLQNSEIDPDFKRVAVFDTSSTQEDIELVEGNYNVRVMLMYDGNFTIPESLQCFKMKKFMKKSKCEWVYLPGPGDMVMPMPAIEYEIPFTLYKEDMNKNTPITFYGLFVNMPGANNLVMDEISVFENMAEKYKDKLTPQK